MIELGNLLDIQILHGDRVGQIRHQEPISKKNGERDQNTSPSLWRSFWSASLLLGQTASPFLSRRPLEEVELER